MMKFRNITAAASAAAILVGAVPAFAVESVAITPSLAVASISLSAQVTPEDVDVSYQWLSGDSETGPFTPIYKATDRTYIYSTNDKNKYVTVQVTDNSTGEVTQSADVRTAASLGPVGTSSLSMEESDAAYTFYLDGQGFVLLDEFKDENSAYFVLAESLYGSMPFDTDSNAVFNPESENNIAYFLNNGLLEQLPQGIAENINTGHVWWTEAGASGGDCPEDYSVSCGVSLLSMSEAVKYKNRFGGSPDGENGSWWLRTQRGRSGADDNIITVSSTRMSDVVCTEESGIRPAFYLGEDFFGTVKLDTADMGAEIKNLIMQTYSREELEGLYSMEELLEIGYEADPGTVISGAQITADSDTIGAEVTLTASYEVSGADGYLYQWLESTDPDAGYTEIRNADEADYFITTMDKNKYLNCRITPIIGGEEQDPVIPEEPVFVENLGFVSEVTFSSDEIEAARATPAENTFQLEGSDRKYVLLDTFNDDSAEFYVMADYLTGPIEADQSDPGVFDPTKEGNIAYWLENNFKTTGYEIAGVHKDPIEQEFLPYVDQDHVWWSEAGIDGRADDNGDLSYTGAFSVLSHSEALKYYGVYGWQTVTEHGGWWLHYFTRTASDSTDSFFTMRNGEQVTDTRGNYVVSSIPAPPATHEEYAPRPVFYLSHDFFLDVAIQNEGENVKKAIRESYSVNELLASGYTLEMLKEKGWVDIPEAENVEIVGSAKVGGELYGGYDYLHASGKAEQGSVIGFEKSDAKDDGYTQAGQGSVYNVTSSDEGKYIRFYVEPADADGVVGERCYSEPVYVQGSATIVPIEAKLVTETGTPIESLAGISEIQVQAELKNVTSSEQSATIMIWLYNSSNRAVSNMAYEVTVPAGETLEVSEPSLRLGDIAPGYYARIYIINDLAGMESLCANLIEVGY